MTVRSNAVLYPATRFQRHRFGITGMYDLLALYRQRRELAEMPDYLLKDIGLTRRQADLEAGKPLWDVPTHWGRRF